MQLPGAQLDTQRRHSDVRGCPLGSVDRFMGVELRLPLDLMVEVMLEDVTADSGLATCKDGR